MIFLPSSRSANIGRPRTVAGCPNPSEMGCSSRLTSSSPRKVGMATTDSHISARAGKPIVSFW